MSSHRQVKSKVAFGVISLLLLAGCARQIDTAASPATEIKKCETSALSLQIGNEGAAMGTIGFTDMTFTNISQEKCTLSGFASLQMLDGSGKKIPTHSTHEPMESTLGNSNEIVSLSPGQKAHFDIRFHNMTGYANAYCPTSTKVLITPPGQKKGLLVDWQINPYGGSTIQKLNCGGILVAPVRAGISSQ